MRGGNSKITVGYLTYQARDNSDYVVGVEEHRPRGVLIQGCGMNTDHEPLWNITRTLFKLHCNNSIIRLLLLGKRLVRLKRPVNFMKYNHHKEDREETQPPSLGWLKALHPTP